MPKVQKTDQQWKQELDPERYQVLRHAATEAPFSGELNAVKDPGTFRCAACGEELFSSDAKFESGSGWPSFYKPVADERVAEREDRSLLMRRTEVLCGSCESHLGHVFDDGPEPTGQRYCINSLALEFDPDESE